MTPDEFDALVRRIERRDGHRPRALRARTAVWLLIGYIGFVFWLLLVLALTAALLAGAFVADSAGGLLLLLAGAFLLTLGLIQVAQLVWVPLESPQELQLTRGDYPRLFDCLDRLRPGSGAARVHRVIATVEFNASVAEVPRLGVFGWPRRWLMLGVPLLEAVSPEEFEALLAHEFAHLSARHGRFTAWVYRLRQSWERVFAHFQAPAQSTSGRWLRRMLQWFIEWYWPRFHAYAFVLSRSNEYDADRCAADWGGSGCTASLLWRTACHSQRVGEKFWPDVWKSTNTQAEPPLDIVSRLIAALAARPDAEDARRWTELAARRLTDNTDTHPSLADRVQAIGESVDRYVAGGFPVLPRVSAASDLLEERRDALQREVSAQWRKSVADTWRKRHRRAGILQQQLAGRAVADAAADAERLWDRAMKVLDLEGPRAAEPLLRQYLELRPTHAAANFVLGCHLLEQGVADGEQHLQLILDGDDESLIPRACEVLAGHFQATGRPDRLQEVRARLSRHQSDALAAQRERNTVTASDRFLPHDLSDEELSALQDVLARHSDLEGAYLVRKELTHFPQQRLFVLCVHTARNMFGRSRSERDARLVQQLIPAVRLPGRALVIAPQGPFRNLGRTVMGVAGAELARQSIDTAAPI